MPKPETRSASATAGPSRLSRQPCRSQVALRVIAQSLQCLAALPAATAGVPRRLCRWAVPGAAEAEAALRGKSTGGCSLCRGRRRSMPSAGRTRSSSRRSWISARSSASPDRVGSLTASVHTEALLASTWRRHWSCAGTPPWKTPGSESCMRRARRTYSSPWPPRSRSTSTPPAVQSSRRPPGQRASGFGCRTKSSSSRPAAWRTPCHRTCGTGHGRRLSTARRLT
mmetsp:Transcript_82296/g.241593  ORF Transcript_82296/g.241593 Transcript_82296/m.241593 type:complete len:226 (-) Transcript_82296:558-1235(-)